MKFEKKQLEVVNMHRTTAGNVVIQLREKALEHENVVAPADMPEEFQGMAKGMRHVMRAGVFEGVMGGLMGSSPVISEHTIVMSPEEYEKMPLVIGALIDASFDWPDQ